MDRKIEKYIFESLKVRIALSVEKPSRPNVALFYQTTKSYPTRRIHLLSSGNQMKVSIGAALIHNPKVLKEEKIKPDWLQ